MSQDLGLDAILQELGYFGKYNIVNYALLLFPVYLAGMFGSVYVFEATDINYRCNITNCEGVNNNTWLEHAIPKEKQALSKCKRFQHNNHTATCSIEDFDTSIVEDCDRFVYSDEDSAVRDFDLGCQDWKRTLVGSIHNTGLFISLPLTGIISDRYGRKVALAVASLMNGIFGFLRSFSTSYIMMLVFEFLEAALGAGAYSTAFVLAVELVGPKGRVFGNTLINAVYVLGLMSLASLSWWLQNWRHLLRLIYIPAMFVVSYYWILNESARWLISKGRHSEAAAILKKAAKMNRVNLSEDVLSSFGELEKLKTDTDNEKSKEAIEVEENKENKQSNLMKVIKSGIIRKRVATCSFLWITCTFVYSGLSINSVSLAGNKYVNFMLVAFVEIPANIVCLLVLDRFGRKKVLILTYVLSACLCISLSFVPKDQKWVSLVIYLSGKFSITVAYSSVYIYVSEVFPTNVRQSLLAVCSSLGRIGSTLAPMTPLLNKYYHNLPAIFFGSMALIASVLVFSLPETINVALPDTVEEAERISNRKHQKEPA
ncbi:organic cation transporter protein-like [Maniola hyperantus]|uniref:organic cation transporter protein-like n=1 Tax=Aphantopus hyperantus TaxID=2795564 RepID=UPI001569C44F|nr:organic cation transporter protein-like [Maniola hyperantus]